MFSDQQNQQDEGQTPTLGLGMNPSPTIAGPSQSLFSTAPTTDPVDETPAEEPVVSAAPEVVEPAAEPVATAANSLEDIKNQALSQLSPLVSKLDQTPEEKYKTIMMMIQASDNQELLAEAYGAAKNIQDETAKAEALLNIVNEINYFTQQTNTN